MKDSFRKIMETMVGMTHSKPFGLTVFLSLFTHSEKHLPKKMDLYVSSRATVVEKHEFWIGCISDVRYEINMSRDHVLTVMNEF